VPSVPEGEKVKPQHGIVLVLLISLIACAAAAGDLPPTLPHEFYGSVAIDGSPAPAGTVVTAMIGDTEYGSITITETGRYGDPDRNLGNRLLVTGTEGQNGETITFLSDGAAAEQTAPFTPGRVTRLDLSFEETVPTARFTANVTSGPAPLAVRFTDASTGGPDSWSWDFGDGETSAEQSPTHTYTTPGTYTANLTVANAAGSNSATAAITVQEAGAVEIVRGPYFTGTTTTATSVNWMTQEPAAGTVEYADDAYYAANGGYALSVADTAETAFHRVALENLTPGTLYHYRIVAGNTTLGDRTFRTFPEDGGFTFIVYGDTQLPANIKIVADRIADEDPLFILHTGDQVNAVESVDEWNNFFSSNRRLLANTTIYTTLGNHEYNDTVYYETFGLPQWYSFVCADARFAVLDDNFASNPLSETAWLARDLTNDETWKFVANHHPPYSSTTDRAGGWLYPRAWWGQIMQDNGVTAVFNGHVHAYERYLVDGITYLVTGTGAGSLHPLGPANERPAGYQNSLVHTLGYTKITIHDNGTATGQFVQVARLDPNNSSQVLEVYPPGTAFETYTLTPRARGADLAAVSLDVPAGIVAGNACTVNGTVENLGGTVAGACPITLAADGGLIGSLTVDPLAPGETAEVSFTWTPAAAGEAVLTLSVDPASTVPDIDRTNNVRTVTVTVTEPGAPVANFTANVTAGDAPLAVQFTDASTGAASWAWDFGDNATSTEQNPIHIYTAAGVYTVNLTVENDYGASSRQTEITVTKPEPIVFDASVTVYADEPIVVDNVTYGGSTFFNILAAAGYTYTYAESDAGYTDRKPLLTLTIDGVTYPTKDFGPDYAWKFYETLGTGDDYKYKKALNGYIEQSGTYYIWFGDTSQFGSWDLPTVDNSIYVVELTVDLQPTRPGAPVANFTANVTAGDAPLAVRFTDLSTGAMARSWNFGDGATSTEQNPVHVYTAAGVYTVNLTVTNDFGSDTEVKTGYITVTEPDTQVADFTGTPTTGDAPLEVRFADNSTGKPVQWLWEFGDGRIATTKNPITTYRQPGTYTVNLTATYGDGSSSRSTKADYITVNLPNPVASFTADQARGNADLPVQFTDTSTGSPTSWAWTFGDGATSTDQNPAHTYTTAGTYTVALTVTGGGQAHTEAKAAYITAVDPGVPPAAEFRADTTGGYAPLVVRFFDQSQGDVDEWLWNFGDGATSVDQNPVHTYTAAGTYTVTLTAKKAGAPDSTRTKPAYVTVDDPKPVADFTVTRLRGEAPLTVQFTDNSTGAPPLTRAWDFGDGTNSTLRNPTHVFDHDGEGARTYTVTLTATNSGGNGVKTTAITVVAPPQKEDVTDRVDQTNATATEDVSLTYQDLKLEIPKGHEAKQANGSPITEFSVGIAPDLKEPPAGIIEIGGKAFKLGPEGAKFNPKIPITITFTQDEWEELFGDGRTTKLQRYDGQNWIELENQTRDDTTFTITGYTDSFSVFAPVTTTTTPEPTVAPPSSGGGGSGTATVTSTGTAKLLTASWGGVLRPYLVYVDGKFAHLSLETGVTALDDAGSPLSEIGIAPVSTLPGASSLAFSGYAVDCSPAGATFSPAIDLVFTFTGDEWAALLDRADGDSARLVVQGYDDATGTWTACPTNVDADARTVTASVSHFSTYALFIGTATEAPVTTGPTPTVPAAAATTPPVPPAETGESPLVWIALAVVIVVALAGYLLWKRR